MNTETIERLRTEVGHMQSRREHGASHQPPVAFFEEEAHAILAVLEAAQRWAEASRKMEAARGLGDVEIDAVRGVFDTSDALLALFEEGI